MLKYRATAQNKDGWTFQFFFVGDGTMLDAQKNLDSIVLEDGMFLKYGPWSAVGGVYRC